jgi:hypothetical protein
VIDLSLNEAETLAAKAARGAGFSWGLADEVGRAARTIAADGEDWSHAALALAQRASAMAAPDRERIALWRQCEEDLAGPRPLCPVRTAAALLDDPPDLGAGALRISGVALPIWTDAMLRPSGMIVLRTDDPLAAEADIVIRLGSRPQQAIVLRRAAISEAIFEALNVFATRTYVPESERSRIRGAGGGSIDDE